MEDSISQLLNQCLRDFTVITDSESLVRCETEVSHRRWLDELGRLRVWSGNIGAHQTGQSSLDYRLRDASHLRDETTRLLRRLLQVLRDVVEVTNEDDEEGLSFKIEDDEGSPEIEIKGGQGDPGIKIEDDWGPPGIGTKDNNGSSGVTELQQSQVSQNAAGVTKKDGGIQIKGEDGSGMAEVTNKYEEELDVDVEYDDESSGITDMQQLYQSIADTLNSLFQISMAIRSPADHDRLLNIRTKDDSYFEPWARQHVSHKYPDVEDVLISRLSKAMARQKAILKYRERHRAKLGKGLFEDIETTSTKLSETVATELAPDHDHLQFLDTASNSGLSQTSYATSLMETKMATSIPNPPRASKDRSPFECPYCFHIIVIKHKKDWARHIFRDVMPYVCLSTNCATPSRLYESRHHWFSHMREAHTQGPNGLACPLCHAEILPSFEKHVGRHLEELALFFLPPTDEDGEASDSTPLFSSESRSDAGDLPNYGLKVPIDAESNEEKGNIVTFITQEAIEVELRLAAEAKKLKETDEKKARDKEFRERLKVEFGYSEEEIESLLKKRHEKEVTTKAKHNISYRVFPRRQLETTAPDLIIERRLPTAYLAQRWEDSEDIERHRHARRTGSSKDISLDRASTRALYMYDPEATFDKELTQTPETREDRVQGGRSKGWQERSNRFDRNSDLMVEGVSTLEDDMVSEGLERQQIGSGQPLDGDLVTKESDLPKPANSSRHKSRPNRPQVVQVNQTAIQPDSIERIDIAHRPDVRRGTSEDTFDRCKCFQMWKRTNS